MCLTSQLIDEDFDSALTEPDDKKTIALLGKLAVSIGADAIDAGDTYNGRALKMVEFLKQTRDRLIHGEY